MRSLLAEACLNQLGGGRFEAYSCGSAVAPDQGPHPLVAAALKEAGISPDNLRSAPTWPGQPDTALWSYPDLLDPMRQRPVSVQEVLQTLYSLRRRVELMLSLPMRNVDPVDLRSDLRDLAYAR